MNSFSLLQKIIDSGELNISLQNFSHPLYRRFVKSYKTGFLCRSKLDIAILLRQILLYETSLRGNNQFATLFIPSSKNWPELEVLKRVGLICNLQKNKISITPSWWTPEWLNRESCLGVDYLSTSENSDRDSLYFDKKYNDIFLNNIDGIKSYKSNDQQRAVRSALSLREGESLLINLPTGEGKSLIFHLINEIGFPSSYDGLTVIVVPTVSLALDHEKNLQKIFDSREPFAYVSGRNSENMLLKDSVKNGTKKICILSPEAAYGPFRNTLLISASNGLIKSIIIDEAHIVEEWGNDFRYDFQVFAGLWRQLLNIGNDITKFRTILLSATYTQNAVDTLQTLFTFNSFKIFSAAKLRPEIDFWFAKECDENTRLNRIVEAVIRSPKPTILYTTTVEKANEYYSLLKREGFGSIEIVTGETSAQKRDDVIIKWKDSSLDIVVATSSFGLGINYNHTRSIIHACIPETLSRYYQEIGRGGRDGKSSLSLLIPSYDDKNISTSLNQQKIIGNDKGFKRWQEMFATKQVYNIQLSQYIINLDSSPIHNIDAQGRRNKQWNTQVLLMMVKTNLIELNGVPNIDTEDTEDFDKYIIIKILDENHLNKDYWYEQIDILRNKIYRSNSESLSLMFRLMEEKECPSDLISKVYNLSVNNLDYKVSKICGHCFLCRINSKKYFNTPVKRKYPDIIDNTVERLFSTKSILVEYELNEKNEVNIRGFERKMIKTIESLIGSSIQNFIFYKNADELFFSSKIRQSLEKLPIFIENTNSLQMTTTRGNLPQGSTVIFFPPNLDLDLSALRILKKENHIIFMQRFTKDPSRKSGNIGDVYPYESLQFTEFLNRIN